MFLDLTAAGVDASSADIDDKRYAFHIMTVKHFTDENGQAILQKKFVAYIFIMYDNNEKL